MRLSFTKFFIFICLFGTFLAFTFNVSANAPDLAGKVESLTGMGVAGVWVKWTDRLGDVRYAQTDGNGNYFFKSWQRLAPQERHHERVTNVDVNGSGVKNTKIAFLKPGLDSFDGFGCGQNPHNLTAIMPVTAFGAFKTVTLDVNNVPVTVTPPPIQPEPSVTPGPTATATPTPANLFNESMCKCDGIDSSGPIMSNQDLTFTAYSKVEGADTSVAKVTSMTFYLTRNNDILAKSDPIAPTVIENLSTKVRYKASWTTKIPEPVDRSATYRVFTKIQCSKKDSLAIQDKQEIQVAKPQTNKGFLANIFSFLTSFFAPGKNPPTYKALAQKQAQQQVLSADNKLQIGTFTPGQITQKTCSFIIFKF